MTLADAASSYAAATNTRRRWMLTWETISDDSAARGDVEARGFVEPCSAAAPGGLTLKEALEELQSPTRPDGRPHKGSCCNVEASCSNIATADWIICDYNLDYETGEYLTLSLHIPKTVTAASRKRLLRLVSDYC